MRTNTINQGNSYPGRQAAIDGYNRRYNTNTTASRVDVVMDSIMNPSFEQSAQRYKRDRLHSPISAINREDRRQRGPIGRYLELNGRYDELYGEEAFLLNAIDNLNYDMSMNRHPSHIYQEMSRTFNEFKQRLQFVQRELDRIEVELDRLDYQYSYIQISEAESDKIKRQIKNLSRKSMIESISIALHAAGGEEEAIEIMETTNRNMIATAVYRVVGTIRKVGMYLLSFFKDKNKDSEPYNEQVAANAVI